VRRTDLSPRMRLLLLGTESDWDEVSKQYAKGPKNEREILQALFAVVRTRQCNAVVVEDLYVDRDYRAEFASIYSRVHRAPDRSTTRLVFFALTSADHRSARLPVDADADSSNSCLGYTILRPLTVGKVGRSFIVPPVWPKSADVGCRAETHLHLGDQRFTVDGSPFIHQDAMVMVCAQASIWMSLHYLHVRYGGPRFLPSDITERAYRNLSWYGAPIPTAGLTLHHMVNAVAQLGYAPVFRTFTPDVTESAKTSAKRSKSRASEILRFVMPYLESQFPVILVLPEHAVCAVGHVLSDKLLAKVDLVQRLADWTAGLIVHDDAVGPYRVLCRDTARPGDGILARELRSFRSAHRLEDVQAAIVPVPQRVHSTSDAIEEHIASFLTSSSGKLSELAEYVRQRPNAGGSFYSEWDHAWRRVGNDRLTMRTYLIDTVEYLRALRSPDFNGFSQSVQTHYAQSDWPRAVWITELLSRRRMESSNDRKVIGEVISDPTANRYEPPFLAIHVPGFLIDLRELENPIVYAVADDRPYSFGLSGAYSRQGRSL
jgi:hypothetical protein